MHTNTFVEHIDHKLQRRLTQPRINTDPEDLLHDEIGRSQGADRAKRGVPVGRLAYQITSKEQAGGHAPLLKVRHDLLAIERGRRPDGKRIAKPTGFGADRCLG